MRAKLLHYLAAVAIIIMSGSVAAQEESASPVPPPEWLLKPTVLEGLEGWNLALVKVVQKPGGEVGWHYHYGYEIVIMEEGSLRIEYKDKPPTTLNAGDVTIIPRGVVHRGINVSKTEPYKEKVFLFMEKDKPFRVELPDK